MNYPLFPASKHIRLIKNEKEAAELLELGGLLVFPTETFLALGCIAFNIKSIEKIYEIKKRDLSKPLPILAGNMNSLTGIIDPGIIPRDLANLFWPGPLTILLPAKAGVCPLLQNSRKKIAARITSHKKAAHMANICGIPIVCTSANLSGEKPSLHLNQLSLEFINTLDQANHDIGIAIWPDLPVSKNSLPSTIVEAVPPKTLLLYREGVINRRELEKHNFTVLDVSYL